MVSKSFIAYACLFGFTTSINALSFARDNGSGGSAQVGGGARRSDRTDHHARDLLSKLGKTLKPPGGIEYFPFPTAFPVSTPTDPPNVVSYRDLEALADRGHHHDHTKRRHHHESPSPSPDIPSPVVQNRGIEAFAEKEFHKGEDFLENEVHNLMRRLKLSLGHVSLGDGESAPQPTPSGLHLKGFRDLGSPDDLDAASNEISIDDESQNLDRRLKVSSTKGYSLPPQPTETGLLVAGYRDLEGGLPRLVPGGKKTLLLKGTGGSTATPQPTSFVARNHRGGRTCKFFWPILICEQDVLTIYRSI
jgi:hypothetical protein